MIFQGHEPLIHIQHPHRDQQAVLGVLSRSEAQLQPSGVRGHQGGEQRILGSSIAALASISWLGGGQSQLHLRQGDDHLVHAGGQLLQGPHHRHGGQDGQ